MDDPLPNVEPKPEALCPKCLRPLVPGQHSCIHCGLPVTVHATTGPYEQVLAQGFAFREASSKPHRPIILFGMWLLSCAPRWRLWRFLISGSS